MYAIHSVQNSSVYVPGAAPSSTTSIELSSITWTQSVTSSPNDLLCVKWDVKPYTLTHWTQSGISFKDVAT